MILNQLVDSLKCLPGVGPKSALRLAYFLLQRDRNSAQKLSISISNALEKLNACSLCNNFTELDICNLCGSASRDNSLLCIVEMPTDLLMMEQTNTYNGQYYILMGKLSPLDGIGPTELNLKKLIERIKKSNFKEIILATNFTSEGNATAEYISTLLKAFPYKVTRISRGLPMGGEIEFVDSGTLAQALEDRKIIDI
ncbi:MAG: recombination mediator RecR [Candidatus Woesearchaeota archaeon]